MKHEILAMFLAGALASVGCGTACTSGELKCDGAAIKECKVTTDGLGNSDGSWATVMTCSSGRTCSMACTGGFDACCR